MEGLKQEMVPRHPECMILKRAAVTAATAATPLSALSAESVVTSAVSVVAKRGGVFLRWGRIV